jgi:FAD/FMN-containing dehydrogenase
MVSANTIAEFENQLTGRVIAPGDEAFDKARKVFYPGYDRRPAFIVRPASDADVARAVEYARDHGLELAVRSGGHSIAGHSVSEGGLVIDLSQMKAMEIDPAAKTAWAQTGLTAGQYTAAAAAHGLATGFGDTGSVGIGGITLGGGVGYLSRKYGLTIDSLLAAEVVTADGQILHTDADTHPDLFWAIRGGGGNFGVVTRFLFRLSPVESFMGGLLLLPAEPKIIADFIAEAEAAPEELSGIANIMAAPPMPFLPEEVHGKLVIMAMMAYVGDEESAQRALAPFRALAAPLADMLAPMRYTDMFPEEEGEFPAAGVASQTMFIDSVDSGVAQTILDFIQSSNAMMRVAQLRVLGGAVARVPADATAYAHRGRRIMVNVAALYSEPSEASQHETWVTDFSSALRQGEGNVYVNFLGHEGPERVRAAYPGAHWQRLSEIKAKYDPDNLFRLNQNIPPANGSSTR